MSNKYKDGYYVVSQNEESDRPFHWVLKAPNHEVILNASGHHFTQAEAIAEIELVQNNCTVESNYKKLVSSNEKDYFTFSVDDDILGKSQMYESTDGRDNGIESCQDNGRSCLIVNEDLETISDDTCDENQGTSESVETTEPTISKKDTRYA